LDLAVANRPHCRDINTRALEEIARLKPDVVLVSARWELYMPRRFSLADVRDTLDRIAATGARVVVVDHSPTFDFAHPYDVVYRNGRNEVLANPAPAAIVGGHSAAVFNPAPLFCSGRLCRLSDERGFLFFDGGHYSVEGSRRVARALAPLIDADSGPLHNVHTSQAR
jgi:hypothetical protein